MRWLAVIHYTDGTSWSRWAKTRRKARKWALTTLRGVDGPNVSGVAIVNVAK